MSRSVLDERFVDLIGQPPMQYLARWRMQPREARDSDAKLIEIALDVGYESEAAFSRTFKRELPLTSWTAMVRLAAFGR